jgi:2-oxoglutarate ferredoxin oxidoreductase subunit beta
MNNQIYGLTLGQSSPSSQQGHMTLTAPDGVVEPPINPITLALASGASFVGRGYSGYSKHLQELIVDAINHKGFSFVDTLSPCVTFNKLNTYDWFIERIYQLENHDSTDPVCAYRKGIEWGDKIPIGVFYKNEKKMYHKPTNYIKQSLILEELGVNSAQIFKEFR